MKSNVLYRYDDIKNKPELPDNLRGRNIHSKVIPTMCNLKNMLDKLTEVRFDYNKLKQWEKRCYNAYAIEEIKYDLKSSDRYQWVHYIRSHILSKNPMDMGASCMDIYLVAYVAENFGIGKEMFFKYMRDKNISHKENTLNAIYRVGKGDGVFLDILNNDGTIKDWKFVLQWINSEKEELKCALG